MAGDQNALSGCKEVADQIDDRVGLARAGRPLDEDTLVAFETLNERRWASFDSNGK